MSKPQLTVSNRVEETFIHQSTSKKMPPVESHSCFKTSLTGCISSVAVMGSYWNVHMILRHSHVCPLAVVCSWCCPTHCHMSLHSSCHCVVPPLPLTRSPPKCSRWCLSPVQSGWWMYHWFPSPPRPLLVGCSPPLVEWSTWQCSSQLPQQQPAKLLSELEKCFAH